MERGCRNYETDATSRRIEQLERRALQGSLDAAHVQAIHRYIFQDVYSWAGEFRTVGISRLDRSPSVNRSSPVCTGFTRNSCGSATWQNSVGTSSLAAPRIIWASSMRFTPCAEGNGRTQREYIRQLAARCGHRLGWAPVTHEQMYAASVLSFRRGDNSDFERILFEALET